MQRVSISCLTNLFSQTESVRDVAGSAATFSNRLNTAVLILWLGWESLYAPGAGGSLAGTG